MDGFGRLSVLQHVRHLRGEVLKEAAPACDVDSLHPAADPEDREVAFLSEVNQVQLEIRAAFADASCHRAGSMAGVLELPVAVSSVATPRNRTDRSPVKCSGVMT